MLKRIEEFGRYAEITGFRNVKIGKPREFLKEINRQKSSSVEVQFFDARFIATWQHLYFAALNALTAFSNCENISKSLSMETLLYAAAHRQITKATELVGIRRDSSTLAVLIIGEKLPAMKSTYSMILKNVCGRRDEKVLDLSKQKAEAIEEAFDISETELRTITKKDDFNEALIALIMERMALLATQR